LHFGMVNAMTTKFGMVAVCAFAGITRVCALGLLPILVALVPLADASPPDPSWLAGIYDAADFDEVVVAVISAAGTVSSIVLPSPNPGEIPTGTVKPRNAVLLVGAHSFTFTIRAPPFSTRIAIL